METSLHASSEEGIDVHARCLVLEMEAPFRANGDQLRRCITAVRQDDPILHHHLEGAGRLTVPDVRFVVTQGVPRLVGVNGGLEALERLYGIVPMTLRNREGDKPVVGRELWDVHAMVGVSSRVRVYRSLSPWLALNQDNYHRYQRAKGQYARNLVLEEIFVGNVLTMLGGFGLRIETRLNARVLRCRERPIRHKDINMLGFHATVESNAILHPWLGIGKLVSKGFGLFCPSESRRPDLGSGTCQHF